jgi:hypothetical protein
MGKTPGTTTNRGTHQRNSTFQSSSLPRFQLSSRELRSEVTGGVVMSAIRPEFLKVLRADVERVGLEGAHVLALIRYVTDLPGERNGRVTIGGDKWWQASYADIADALVG